MPEDATANALPHYTVSSFDNNSALHCLTHLLLRGNNHKYVPEETKQLLLDNFKQYYCIYDESAVAEDNSQVQYLTKVTWVQLTNFLLRRPNPKDRELILGPVLRQMLAKLLLQENFPCQAKGCRVPNHTISIRDLLFKYFVSDFQACFNDTESVYSLVDPEYDHFICMVSKFELLNSKGNAHATPGNALAYPELMKNQLLIDYWNNYGFRHYAKQIRDNYAPLDYPLIYCFFHLFHFSITSNQEYNDFRDELYNSHVIADNRHTCKIHYSESKKQYSLDTRPPRTEKPHNEYYRGSEYVIGEEDIADCENFIEEENSEIKVNLQRTRIQLAWVELQIEGWNAKLQEARENGISIPDKELKEWQKVWFYYNELCMTWEEQIKVSKLYLSLEETRDIKIEAQKKIDPILDKEKNLNDRRRKLPKKNFYIRLNVKSPRSKYWIISKLRFLLTKLVNLFTLKRKKFKHASTIHAYNVWYADNAAFQKEIKDTREFKDALLQETKNRVNSDVDSAKNKMNTVLAPPCGVDEKKKPNNFTSLSQKDKVHVTYAVKLDAQKDCRAIIKLVVKHLHYDETEKTLESTATKLEREILQKNLQNNARVRAAGNNPPQGQNAPNNQRAQELLSRERKIKTNAKLYTIIQKKQINRGFLLDRLQQFQEKYYNYFARDLLRHAVKENLPKKKQKAVFDHLIKVWKFQPSDTKSHAMRAAEEGANFTNGAKRAMRYKVKNDKPMNALLDFIAKSYVTAHAQRPITPKEKPNEKAHLKPPLPKAPSR